MVSSSVVFSFMNFLYYVLAFLSLLSQNYLELNAKGCIYLEFSKKQLLLCRQKQYFEQRKRQQLQPEVAHTENNIDGLVTNDDKKRNRSLDILSLLNVSKFTEECKPLYGIGEHYLTICIY